MVITPEKFLVFERNEDTLEASIQISNISSQEIVYKVKEIIIKLIIFQKIIHLDNIIHMNVVLIIKLYFHYHLFRGHLKIRYAFIQIN